MFFLIRWAKRISICALLVFGFLFIGQYKIGEKRILDVLDQIWQSPKAQLVVQKTQKSAGKYASKAGKKISPTVAKYRKQLAGWIYPEMNATTKVSRSK